MLAGMSARKELGVKHRVALLSSLLILAASLPAMAQRGEGGRRLEQVEPARSMPAQKQMPAREANRQNHEAPRDARMTPEARRQLRRDVHEHGREIYHERAGPGKR
jgi:hypothetical protein